jgi:hypothetical protein
VPGIAFGTGRTKLPIPFISGILSEGDKRDSKSDMPRKPPSTLLMDNNIAEKYCNIARVGWRGRGYFAPEPASRTRPRRFPTRIVTKPP